MSETDARFLLRLIADTYDVCIDQPGDPDYGTAFSDEDNKDRTVKFHTGLPHALKMRAIMLLREVSRSAPYHCQYVYTQPLGLSEAKRIVEEGGIIADQVSGWEVNRIVEKFGLDIVEVIVPRVPITRYHGPVMG